MRRAITTIVTMAVLATAAAAPAQAAPGPSTQAAAPRLSLGLERALIAQGDAVKVHSYAGPNEQVALYAAAATSPTFRAIRVSRANADGFVAWSVAPVATTRFYSRVLGAPASRNSPTATMKVLRRQPLPKQVWETLYHGARVVGVYVVTTPRADDARLAAAVRSLATYGYEAGAGGLGCDLGADEVTGSPDWAGVAVYFRTNAEAEVFVSRYRPGVDSWGPVTTICMD